MGQMMAERVSNSGGFQLQVAHFHSAVTTCLAAISRTLPVKRLLLALATSFSIFLHPLQQEVVCKTTFLTELPDRSIGAAQVYCIFAGLQGVGSKAVQGSWEELTVPAEGRRGVAAPAEHLLWQLPLTANCQPYPKQHSLGIAT